MANLTTTRNNQVDRIRENLHYALDRWAGFLTRDRRDDESFWSPTLLMNGAPMVDVEEDDNEVLVTAEMPGLSEEDFRVEISGNRLVISGEKRAEREEKRKKYYYAERHYGSFTRVVPLPCEVDEGKAKAKYRHGILRIHLPKTEQAKKKRITVQVS